jgi:hypothetical protein
MIHPVLNGYFEYLLITEAQGAPERSVASLVVERDNQFAGVVVGV